MNKRETIKADIKVRNTAEEMRDWGSVGDIKTIKRQLNMDAVTGWSSVVAYIKAGHGLTTLKAETTDWAKFLADNKISVARDYRARLLAKHDMALLRAVPQVDSLSAALELCQRLEDEPAPAEAETDAPKPAKMGRPRKSDCEKWRTRLNRLIADAPDEVQVVVDGNEISITL